MAAAVCTVAFLPKASMWIWILNTVAFEVVFLASFGGQFRLQTYIIHWNLHWFQIPIWCMWPPRWKTTTLETLAAATINNAASYRFNLVEWRAKCLLTREVSDLLVNARWKWVKAKRKAMYGVKWFIWLMDAKSTSVCKRPWKVLMGFLLGLGLSDHPQTKFCFCLCAEVARQLKFKLPSGKVYLPPHSPARAESRQPCNLNTRAVIPFILACFHWRGLLKAIFCPHPHDVPAGKGEVRENQPEPAHSRVPVLSDRRTGGQNIFERRQARNNVKHVK